MQRYRCAILLKPYMGRFSILGSKIDKRPVTYGKAGQVSSMLCVCHSPHDDLCFAGADNGEIYVWQGTTLRRTIKGHRGAVYAMYALRNSAKEVCFYISAVEYKRFSWRRFALPAE